MLNTPIFKRPFDIIFSIAALVLLTPIIVIMLVLIRLESKGNPLFIQERLGRHQRPFKCLKLRTLYDSAPMVSTHELPQSYVTKVGGFLRKTKLDELPQFLNVLLGSMSLVGPRPCLKLQYELINEREMRQVFQIKPGITGLAQVKGVGTENAALQASLDSEYMRKLSFSQDLKLLLQTFNVIM